VPQQGRDPEEREGRRQGRRYDEEGNIDITHRLATIGTTAVIRSVKEWQRGETEYGDYVNIVTVGRQRFNIIKAWADKDGLLKAKVIVLEDLEPIRMPKGIFFQHSTKHHPKNRKGKHIPQLPDLSQQTPTPHKCTKLSLAWHPYWIYSLYDTRKLSTKAEKMVQEILNVKWESGPPHDPAAISYWLARNLPVDDDTKLQLLACTSVADRLRKEILLMESYFVLGCNKCGSVFGKKKDLFQISEGLVDAYVNPGGVVHDVVTIKKVSGAKLRGTPQTEHSWFPGYAWTIAECNECRSHIGWRFTATSSALVPQEFWGLTRTSITHNLDEKQKAWAAEVEERERRANQARTARDAFMNFLEQNGLMFFDDNNQNTINFEQVFDDYYF